MTIKAKISRPCKLYLKGLRCEGSDHCFNCARHLDPTTLACPKGCGDDEATNERVSNADQDEE